VEHPSEAARIGNALRDRGIVPDVRPPNIIRMASIPLYNFYREIWMAIRRLREVMDTQAYEAYPCRRPTVS
jgi:kynureninase